MTQAPARGACARARRSSPPPFFSSRSPTPHGAREPSSRARCCRRARSSSRPLFLAAVAVGSRGTFGTGLAVAASAHALLLPGELASGSPFAGPLAALAAGLGLAAWASRALDRANAPSWAGLALRGGFLLVAGGYAGFGALGALALGMSFDVVELVLRALAALAVAAYVDAPTPRASASAGSTSPVARS